MTVDQQSFVPACRLQKDASDAAGTRASRPGMRLKMLDVEFRHVFVDNRQPPATATATGGAAGGRIWAFPARYRNSPRP